MWSNSTLSKSQVDRLGDRLRYYEIMDADLVELECYRSSFTSAYEYVIVKIHDQLGLEATGRPAKSTSSIIGKLRRESIRLSQMQDIAGCSLIVTNVITQDSVV